ncbi:MAG: hypothetical protein QXN66_06285 [Thermoplasmatales archaeon]
MISYITILDWILTFVVGLLFGLAIKKGVVAFVLAIVGFVIAGYVGISFIPKISVSYEIGKAIRVFDQYIRQVQFATLSISLSIVLLLIGLAIGIWKG